MKQSQRLQTVFVFGLLAVFLAPAAFSSLTDEETACLRRWHRRTLPPTVDAAVPPEIAPQPFLRDIQTWNGTIVAFGGENAYRVDVDGGHLVPLELPDCRSPLGLGENATSLFALCSRAEKLYLRKRSRSKGAAWETAPAIPRPDVWLGSRSPPATPRLVVSEGAVAIVGAEAVWWMLEEDSKWRRSRLRFADPPGALGFRFPPTATMWSSGSLFLGWDLGSHGGWFYRLQFGPDGLPTGRPDLIRKLTVHSIELGDDGVIWVGARLRNMLLAGGKVLRIEGPSVRTILDETNRRCEPAGEMGLPQAAAIDALDPRP